MKNLSIFIIIILAIFLSNVIFADETIREYDRGCNITGYVVNDDDGNKTFYDSGWNKTGYSTYKNNKTIKYDLQHGRSGYIKWNNSIGIIYNKNHDKVGYIKKQDGKETFYDKDWRWEGYRK